MVVWIFQFHPILSSNTETHFRFLWVILPMTFIWHPDGKVMLPCWLIFFFERIMMYLNLVFHVFLLLFLAYSWEEDCKVFKIVVICYASPFLYLILFP